jgi:AraC-like DNA-binding protein
LKLCCLYQMRGASDGRDTGTMNDTQAILSLLYGAAAAAMIANGLGLLRAPTRELRLTGALFAFSVAAYALKLWELGGVTGPEATLGRLPMPLSFAVSLLSLGGTGWFWLFVRVLFDDRKPAPAHYAVVAALVAVGMAASNTPWEVSQWFWVAFNIGQAALSIAMLLIVARSWRADLVETRRRLRAPFLVVSAAFALTISLVDTADTIGAGLAWFPLVNAAGLAACTIAGTVVFLDSRSDLFGQPETLAKQAAAPAPLAAAAPDRATQADLDRLDRLMSQDEVWRSEGLTIAGLALRMNLPETQLRRLINDHLGHRNFPSFVNARRIAAAKKRLADPNEARVSISTIAFDIGFGSLGPFNRAFREATGKSPSEWRREALGQTDAHVSEPPAG